MLKCEINKRKDNLLWKLKRKQPLGIELVRRGVVNGDAIEKALQYQTEHPNRRLGDILYILKRG